MISFLLGIVRSIPVLLKIFGTISDSWYFLTDQERELLEKMHNGNGQLASGRGSWGYKGERKGIIIFYANGAPLFKPKDQSEDHFLTYRNYEEAHAKLIKKGYIESGKTKLGSRYFDLTAKGHLLKKYF